MQISIKSKIIANLQSILVVFYAYELLAIMTPSTLHHKDTHQSSLSTKLHVYIIQSR